MERQSLLERWRNLVEPQEPSELYYWGSVTVPVIRLAFPQILAHEIIVQPLTGPTGIKFHLQSEQQQENLLPDDLFYIEE